MYTAHNPQKASPDLTSILPRFRDRPRSRREPTCAPTRIAQRPTRPDAPFHDDLLAKEHPDPIGRPTAGPDAPRHPDLDRATAPARSHRRRSILVVDDNEMVTAALRLRLVEAGYDVTALESGLEALKHAQQTNFDAAVIDVHLNDINGLVLTQRLRDLYGNAVPIIVLSGDTSMETLNSLPLVGATYFIPKPVQSAQLIEQLRQWVV